MAFYPIGGSTESTGEYCQSLFWVVGISLMVSWVIAVTLTPVKCLDILPAPERTQLKTDAHAGSFYRIFRRLLEKAIRFRRLFMGGMAALLVMSFLGFGAVERLFFPASSMEKFMIDFHAPQGTRIEAVATDLELIESHLLQDERVDNVATFLAAGPPRFYLPVEPESANSAYAQLIVNVADMRTIDALIRDLKPWLDQTYPDTLVSLRKFGVGPGKTWKFQYRISGPAVADAKTLRTLSQQVLDVLREEPRVATMQTDWRQKVPRLITRYNQERARRAGISRENVADAGKRAFDGLPVGLYREGDELIPVVLRHAEEDRANVGALDILQVKPDFSTRSLPMLQVLDGVEMGWEETRIWRRDRRRTITVQANPVPGVTLPTLLKDIQARVEGISLPPGYRAEWGGEAEDSAKSGKALVPGVIPAVAIMAFILVALFNAFKPPLIIALTIPFALIGITTGLLVFNAPFGFMALLGAMSLSGMMIKNAIVLLDEVNINLSLGKARYDAVVEAALSRLRPVVLAAGTTVLGVIPLLQDVFWVGMAVTIMVGLAFGTILTMLVVPVLYCFFYKVPSPSADMRVEPLGNHCRPAI